jgi:hypothetical protein
VHPENFLPQTPASTALHRRNSDAGWEAIAQFSKSPARPCGATQITAREANVLRPARRWSNYARCGYLFGCVTVTPVPKFRP